MILYLHYLSKKTYKELLHLQEFCLEDTPYSFLVVFVDSEGLEQIINVISVIGSLSQPFLHLTCHQTVLPGDVHVLTIPSLTFHGEYTLVAVL